MPEKKPALLLFELHHLGDALMSFPFIRGACEKYEVWVVCAPRCVELYEQILPRGRIMAWQPLWQGGSWREGWAALRAWRGIRAEAAVCVWSDARVHGLMFFSGAARRVGYPMNRRNYYAREGAWREWPLIAGKILQSLGRLIAGGRLLTDSLERIDYRQHHLRDWFQLSECLGLARGDKTPWITVDLGKVPPALKNFLETARAQGKKSWLIHSGGRLAGKRWPKERYKELVDSFFRERQIPCVIFGEGWEGEADDDILFHSSFLDMAAFVAVMDSVDFFLGNDSYPAHLAGALGKQTVTIFGSGNPDWFAPWKNESNVIAGRNCIYGPARDRCEMPDSIYLEAVRVAEVKARLEALIEAAPETNRQTS